MYYICTKVCLYNVEIHFIVGLWVVLEDLQHGRDVDNDFLKFVTLNVTCHII